MTTTSHSQSPEMLIDTLGMGNIISNHDKASPLVGTAGSLALLSGVLIIIAILIVLVGDIWKLLLAPLPSAHSVQVSRWSDSMA